MRQSLREMPEISGAAIVDNSYFVLVVYIEVRNVPGGRVSRDVFLRNRFCVVVIKHVGHETFVFLEKFRVAAQTVTE